MEKQRSGGIAGKLIRTGLILVAAVVFAQSRMPAAQAELPPCEHDTCGWSAGYGYYCIFGTGIYWYCLDGCELGPEC